MPSSENHTEVEAMVHIIPESRSVTMKGYIPGVGPESVRMVMDHPSIHGFSFLPEGANAGSVEEKLALEEQYVLEKILAIL
jgi:hypothetical protein